MPLRNYDLLILQEVTTGRSKTFEEIAEAVGKSSKTVATRFKDPDFVRELWELPRDVSKLSYWRLCRGNDKAIATLEDLMDDENPSIKLRASIAHLNLTLKFSIYADVEERLSRLETSELNQLRKKQ